MDLASIDLEWPEDADAREQMREFIAELADCGSVDDAFAAGIGEDPDGEQRYQRPDLAATAQARLRAWGTEDDAVSRAFELVAWLAREVLAPHFPALPVTVPESFSDSTDLARALEPSLRSAEEAQDERDRFAEQDDTEWAHKELLDRAVLAAKHLGYVPRRVNITEYKPRPQSHPLYVCEKVASGCAEAFLYAIALEPPAATA